MRIAGVIIAGGGGTRMGPPAKPLVPLGEGTLLDAVLARVRPQVGALALNVPADQADLYAPYAAQDIPLIYDPLDPPVGPLGGIIAGLAWLREQDAGNWLATFPADTPFLPADLVEQMGAYCDSAAERVIVAHDGERLQPLCALWPGECLEPLRRGVEEDGWRAIQRSFDAFGSIVHECPDGPQAFFNINTPEDLRAASERLERIAG